MNKTVNNAIRFTKKNAPTILTIVASFGTVSTAVLAARGAIKANQIIQLENGRRVFEDGLPELTFKEEVINTWDCYVPAIISEIVTVACIIGSNEINKKHQAGLVSAYVLLDRAYSEYRQKALDIYGEGSDVKIRNAIASDHIESELNKNHNGSKLPEGKIQCYEEISNYCFDTTMAEIIDAKYQLNKKFTEAGEVAVNDYFEFLGIPTRDYGEELGWEWSAVMDMNSCSSWLEIDVRLEKFKDGSEYYILSPRVKPYAFNGVDYNKNELPFL